jgi:hypothetical protein
MRWLKPPDAASHCTIPDRLVNIGEATLLCQADLYFLPQIQLQRQTETSPQIYPVVFDALNAMTYDPSVTNCTATRKKGIRRIHFTSDALELP